tara:strand:- start:1089 stop:1625 length:537 start_codon:yes stop_codon:yes gene_type:complete
MGQEFVIKSPTLEDKINQLLPSQGGAQAGVDLSASTTIIPIVDLTESAEGSNLRVDLQEALSLNDVTSFDVTNANTTIINTTGYFRVFGTFQGRSSTSSDYTTENFELTDGTTTKIIARYRMMATSEPNMVIVPFDFNVFIAAGQSLTINSENSGTLVNFTGCVKQLASLDGTLTNPS